MRSDRENTTVLVTGLVKGTSESEVEALFKDVSTPPCEDDLISDFPSAARLAMSLCSLGQIKIQMLRWWSSEAGYAYQHLENALTTHQDSVPAALTKDKKRIGDHEVDVVLLWRATLFVTNFPPASDDEYMRKIFAPVCSSGSHVSQTDP
jgi:hypothetical protein